MHCLAFSMCSVNETGRNTNCATATAEWKGWGTFESDNVLNPTRLKPLWFFCSFTAIAPFTNWSPGTSLFLYTVNRRGKIHVCIPRRKEMSAEKVTFSRVPPFSVTRASCTPRTCSVLSKHKDIVSVPHAKTVRMIYLGNVYRCYINFCIMTWLAYSCLQALIALERVESQDFQRQ